MNILNKLKIHPLTYFILLISTLTGQFKIITSLFLIIIVHEIGHIITAKIFKWKINKITILPFGGNINFDIKLNENIIKEFIVTIMGPIFQIIGTIILIRTPYLKTNEIIMIKNISFNLVIFNLLPIIPLDGSKLLFLITNKFTSYKKSHIIIIVTSIILITMTLIKNSFNLTIEFLIIFLLYKTYEQYKNHNNILNKFLLERYLYKQNRGSIKIIKGKQAKKIWRNKNNIFKHNNKYLTEKEVLDEYFKKTK